MSVFSRSALEASPLADLHAIAGELGVDGFRRLRKADLINAILGDTPAQDEPAEVAAEPDGDEAAPDGDEAAPARRRRGGRGGRGRAATARTDEADDDDAGEDGRSLENGDVAEVGGVATSGDADEEPAVAAPAAAEARASRGEDGQLAEGVIELAGNGSAFLRVSGGEDVYVSAAQVRRCELVDGDRVAGPVRRPRRSERYPSLIRVDTINGSAADEVAVGTRFDDLPCAFPSERFALESADPTLKAIEWLTPLGRGSRATIVGPARAGKSEALRRLATALQATEGLEVSVVLLGVRPEELADWRAAEPAPAAELTLGAASDAQAQALERAIDVGRRAAARGGHAAVLVDGLDDVAPQVARRALSAARNIVDGGSLTVIATAAAPLGGETTVIALDGALTAAGSQPALDLSASGTLRPELLVGEDGAKAIAQARAS